MRKKWFVIMPLILFFSACSVGLNKPSMQKVKEVQQQINELNRNFQMVQAETETLNNNLEKLESVLERLADIMESVNKKADIALKIKSLFAP